MANAAEILYGPNGGYCYHQCGMKAQSDGYCDYCYADHCLVPGPDGDGWCRYYLERINDPDDELGDDE